MAIQQNPNWPTLLIKGIGAMAVSDGTNVLGINSDGSINTTITLASPSVFVGDATVHGTVDVQDRVARQLGHVLIDSSATNPVSVTFAPSSTQAVTQSTSPWVVAGDVTIHGTADIIDRAVRQLGLVSFTVPQHIIVDSQPATTLSSPTVVAGDVTIHGITDVQDRVARQLGHVIVDSQPALSLSSPTVVVGDVTIHGTTDVQDRVARQLGIVSLSTSPVVVIGTIEANVGDPGLLARDATLTGGQLKAIVQNFPVTQAVSGTLSLTSPSVIAGDVTVHGTVDVQDRVARQLGNLTSPIVIGTLPSINIGATGGLALDSTLTGGQAKTIVSGIAAGVSLSVTQAAASSPWVVGGDVTTHGTTDVQDRAARQLGIVSINTSPVVVIGTIEANIGDPGLLARDATLTGGQAKTIVTNFPATQAVSGTLSLTSPSVIAGDVTVHGTTDIQDRAARQLGNLTSPLVIGTLPSINIGNTGGLALDSTLTGGQAKVNIQGTIPVTGTLSLTSPSVIAGDVTIHGTVDIQDRAARQLGNLTSPIVIGILPSINIGATGGLALDSTLTGGQALTRISGTIPVSQPAGSSPWVIAGDATVHGIIDVQDRAARQLGNLTSPLVIGTLPSINIGATGGLALDSTLTGGQAKTLISGVQSGVSIPVTQAAASSPWVIAGDATVHGTVDVQDRAARQLGNLTSPVVIGILPSINIGSTGGLALDSTLTGGQQKTTLAGVQSGVSIAITQPAASSPWVVGGDVTIHGTVDIQDRFTRQLGIVSAQYLGSPAAQSSIPLQVDSSGLLQVTNTLRATTANPTAALDGRGLGALVDKIGRQVVVPGHVREMETDATTTISSTTETTVLAAGAAGVFNDIVAIILSNTSATGTRVDIRDGTAGIIRASLYAPATQTTGAVFQIPLKQAEAAKVWTATLGTAVTDVRVFVQAVKNV